MKKKFLIAGIILVALVVYFVMKPKANAPVVEDGVVDGEMAEAPAREPKSETEELIEDLDALYSDEGEEYNDETSALFEEDTILDEYHDNYGI